ncbi:hypothetical protein LCGC14_2838270, partial [marine sediment metagenome]
QYMPLWESGITGNLRLVITNRTINTAINIFTEKYGRPVMAISRKVTKCITRFLTAPIINYPILRFCQSQATDHSICPNPKEEINQKRTWLWRLKRRHDGAKEILKKPAKLEKGAWQHSGRLLRARLKSNILAIFAERFLIENQCTKRGKVKVSAQGCAYQQTEESPKLTMLIGRVFYAGLVFVLTNTLKGGLARLVAKESCSQYQKVYNITVVDAHCYYANGYLVSNCEALEYGLMGEGEGKALIHRPIKEKRQRPRDPRPGGWMGR